MESSGRDIDGREASSSRAIARTKPAPLRDEFLLDEEGVVYMDGNSLGRPPRAVLGSLDARRPRRLGRASDPLLDGGLDGPAARPR